MLVNLVNAFPRNEVIPFICVTRDGLDLKIELDSTIPLLVLNRKRSLELSAYRKLKRFIETEKIDLLHAHGRSTALFLIVGKLLGYIKKPIILHDHSGDIVINHSVPFWFRMFGNTTISHYVGVSEELQDWALKAGINPKRVSFIANAIDLDQIRSRIAVDLRSAFGIESSRKIGIVVANPRYEKGIDLLIEALKCAKFELNPLIIIVGERSNNDYIQNCDKLMARYNLMDVIKFAGKQENAVGWMKGADFGIMPSRSESGPLVLIEMAAVGLPIVGFNVGNITNQLAELMPENFAEAENVLALADLLEKANFGKISNMKVEQTSSIFINFDINSVIHKWIRVYKSVLKLV